MAELVARVHQQDESAARVLAERLYPLVARVVHSHLPRRDEPDDLMQDVFLKMFTKLDQYRGEVPFEHWVSRIALTTCLDRLRRQRARPELRWADLSEEEKNLLEGMAAPTEPVDADVPRALELLTRLLDELPAQDAWLLREVELEQKSLADVCAATGWTRCWPRP